MENRENLHKFLELMEHPAFFVRGGCILDANGAALARLILPGTAVAGLLGSAAADYDAFSCGVMSLPLTTGAKEYTACVQHIGGGDLFLLAPENEETELRALALAAQQLRLPLNQALNTVEVLLSTKYDEPGSRQQLAELNRSLYQILRVVLNMSDARQALSPRLELMDLHAVFQELLDRAAVLCQAVGIHLHYSAPPGSIYSLADSGRLERAFYNLLSNALTHTPKDGAIEVSLTRRNGSVYLTMTNPGTGSDRLPAAGAFRRFLREPGLENSRAGLGLGMHLVQSAAAAHGGTVLMEPLPDGGMRVTMRLAIRQKNDEFRAPPLRIDYAGERDHALIELADLLPGSLYGNGL